jgi:hypothetical protein
MIHRSKFPTPARKESGKGVNTDPRASGCTRSMCFAIITHNGTVTTTNMKAATGSTKLRKLLQNSEIIVRQIAAIAGVIKQKKLLQFVATNLP